MIPRAALQTRAREWGLTEEVVEKDYVLGWLRQGLGDFGEGRGAAVAL